MIKFVRGEAVSYNSTTNRVIQVTLDLLNENLNSPVFGYLVKRGDVLIIKDVQLNTDNTVVIWVYGSATGLRFVNLAQARVDLARTSLKVSTLVISCITSTVYYKAHLNYHRALDNTYNAVHSLEGARHAIDMLYSHLAENDMLYPRSYTDQMLAMSEERIEYSLVANAMRIFLEATGNHYPSHLLVFPTDTTQSVVPEPDEDYPWDPDENLDPGEEEEPLWVNLGFDSEDQLEDALNDYYWDLLDDEGVEHENLNNSERNSYRNRAFSSLVKDCTEIRTKKSKKSINNGQMLKFKDLINVNIKGAIRPAICLADLPANINFETTVPILYKYKDEYIKATIPYINIVNPLAKIEDIATRVKIKDFKESSDIFGYRKTKESVVGNIFSYVAIEKGYTCKKDGKVRDTIVVDLGKSDFRFVLSDVEFVLPQVNRVQLKKNKTISTASFCTIFRIRGGRGRTRRRRGRRESPSKNVLVT
jgi:hypothetical protein